MVHVKVFPNIVHVPAEEKYYQTYSVMAKNSNTVLKIKIEFKLMYQIQIK